MKKNLIYILLIVILSTISIYFYTSFKSSTSHEKENVSTTFSLSKIIYYSGIAPESNFISNSKNWNLDISQYTDIAIYIENDGKELSDINTIKQLYIDNIKISQKPKLGSPKFYYQPLFNFSTNSIINSNLIDNHLSFNILNFENSENENYYATPVFFTDCSTPLTIKYLNPSVLKNYTLDTDKTLFFNGKILQDSNINLNDLDATIEFDINLISNSNVFYKTNVKTNIPLSDSKNSKTLFDDNIYTEKKLNTKFNIISKN